MINYPTENQNINLQNAKNNLFNAGFKKGLRNAEFIEIETNTKKTCHMVNVLGEFAGQVIADVETETETIREVKNKEYHRSLIFGYYGNLRKIKITSIGMFYVFVVYDNFSKKLLEAREL